MPYFNYSLHLLDPAAASFWERRSFLHAWWAIGGDDARRTPPGYAGLRRDLDPRHNAHLARLRAEFIHIEALHRTGVRRSRTDQQEIPLTSILEQPLAAAVASVDPRRQGTTAHLGLLRLAADAEAFDRLYYHLVEVLSAENYHRVVGPIGLSPHLGSGVLLDAWDAWPPQHTPTNPPYLPELLERRLRPWLTGRLYHVTVPAQAAAPDGADAAKPFAPARLAGDLLPLLVAATDNAAGFPPPDATEAAYLLRQAGPGAFGGLVEGDDGPAGFVLLAPDMAGRLRATHGGRPLWGRAALALTAGRPVSAGRVLWGGVLPAWRGRGVGSGLWAWALAAARARGWESLTVGPIWSPREKPGNLARGEVSTAAAFLAKRGAMARQTYRLYEATF